MIDDEWEMGTCEESYYVTLTGKWQNPRGRIWKASDGQLYRIDKKNFATKMEPIEEKEILQKRKRLLLGEFNQSTKKAKSHLNPTNVTLGTTNGSGADTSTDSPKRSIYDVNDTNDTNEQSSKRPKNHLGRVVETQIAQIETHS